jgi:hypothetical protein
VSGSADLSYELINERVLTRRRVLAIGTQGGEDQGMEILKFLWEPGNIKRLREELQHIALS